MSHRLSAIARFALVALAVLSIRLTEAHAADPVNVVATLTDLGKIAEAVGGDRVLVTTLAPGVQDPHFVDPKPSHMVKLRDADLLLLNGLDLEVGWLPPLIDGSRNGRIRAGAPGYVDCSRGIPALEVPAANVTRAAGDVHPFGNPHYTTDPLNHKVVADTVSEALTRARPAESVFFEARRKAFHEAVDRALFGPELVELVGGKKLDRLARAGELASFLDGTLGGGAKLRDKLGGWLGKMGSLRGRRIVFHHRSYSYFTQRFGLEVVDYVELKAGIQPGPTHLAELISHMRREGTRIVATHPFHDRKVAQLVADKAGARLLVLPLNAGGIPGTDDVFKFFDVVTDKFVEALR